MVLLNIIIATTIVSLISLVGAFLFVKKIKKANKYMILFVAFAAGTLIGTAFFHLVPESIEGYNALEDVHAHNLHQDDLQENVDNHNIDEHHHEHTIHMPSLFILLGILLFYVIEKFVHWHHHHDTDCHKHSISVLSLVGDGFHNFVDGVLIAGSFLIDVNVGIVTTIAIIFHEIPQEIGDLALLLHSGMSKTKALFFNFLSGLTAVLGGVLMYFIGNGVTGLIPLITAFAAGGFIYISLADIIPELHRKKHDFSQGAISYVFLFGIIVSLGLLFIGH